MAKQFQFDEFDDRGSDRGKTEAPHCIACEEMLADAVDGGLSVADQAWFDQHVSTCRDCSEMLADAQRGAAWLDMLKTPRPEPSARLMQRILAETTGMEAGVRAQTGQQPQMVPAIAPLVLPLGVPGNLLEFRPRTGKIPGWAQLRSRGGMFEPRLAMTAAMAFFSIALSLNLTGVQLNRLHVSDLSATNLKHTYYTANAEAARYYDNLRVVRVVESRVEDLREAAAERELTPKEQPKEPRAIQPRATPEAPKQQPEEKKKQGVSRQAAPMSEPELPRATREVVRTGEPVATLSKLGRAGGLG